MPVQGGGVPSGYAYVELRLSDTDSISAPIRRQTERVGREAEATLRTRLTSGVQAAGRGINKAMGLIGAAGGAALAAGIAQSLDIQKAQSKLNAQLGLTTQQSQKVGKVAGELFASAYGDSMEDVNNAIKSVVQNMDGMKDASAASLKETAKDALNLATIMDEDVGKVTEAVSQILRTKLAPNAKEAFDLLASGAQNGVDKAQDLLDTFVEYSTQFRKLGLDGKAAMGLLSQGLKAGARDADTVADALKEFSIRAVDMSNTSQVAYAGLGLNAEKMSLQIAKGGAFASSGLQTILDKLRAIKDPVEREALAVGLFGTKAEDLGAALYALDPSKAVASLGQVSGAANRVDKALGQNAQTTFTAWKRQAQMTLVDVIVKDVLPALQKVMDISKALGATGGGVAKLAIAVVGLAAAWKAVGFAVTVATTKIAGVSLVSAFTGGVVAAGQFVAAMRNVNLAYAANATFATRLGAALKSQILLWRATAAAQGVSTARVIALAAAQKIAAAAQAVWTGIIWAWNAATSANPIGLIIIAIVALVAAIVLAYRNSETFRRIVQATWAGIQVAISYAWNNVIKPIWTLILWYIQNLLIPYYKMLWSVFKVVWSAISAYASFVWNNVIKPIWTAISWTIQNILVPYFKLIKFYWELVWFAVKTVLIVNWRIIKGVWDLIVWYIKTLLVPYFKFLWNIAKAVWTGIWNAIKSAWNAIRPIFSAMYNWVRSTLVAGFNTARSLISSVWRSISSVISSVWTSSIRPTFNALKSGVGLISGAFRQAVTSIGRVWDGLRAAARRPVDFVINTVYAKGIKGMWDRVADLVHLPHMPAPPKFATGGIMPGYSPGQDKLLALVSPGEAILRPEFTKAVGSKFINGANRSAVQGGTAGVAKFLAGVGDPGGLPGFAGQFSIGGIVSGFASAAKGLFSGGLMKAAKAAFNPLAASTESAIGGTPWGHLIAGIPKTIINGILNVFKPLEKQFGGSTAAVRAVASQIGVPYSWGGGGPFGKSRGFGRGANTVGFDCSSLMQYGVYQAFHKIMPRVTTSQRPWLKQIGHPIPGAIGQPHAGHTYMYAGQGQIIEAPHTGAFVRRRADPGTPFWGVPPWMADTGGALVPGWNPPILNKTNHPEPILNPRQATIVERALDIATRDNVGHSDNSINVYPQRADFTIQDLEALERRRDALSRARRPK